MQSLPLWDLRAPLARRSKESWRLIDNAFKPIGQNRAPTRPRKRYPLFEGPQAVTVPDGTDVAADRAAAAVPGSRAASAQWSGESAAVLQEVSAGSGRRKGYNKGKKSEAHKLAIARAMQRMYRNNPAGRSTRAPKGPRACPHCGQQGHYKATCPQLNQAKAKQRQLKQSKAKQREPTCRLCGEAGHYQRTCPTQQQTRLIDVPLAAKQRQKRACALCGKDGHDRRNCPTVLPVAPIKAATQLQLWTEQRGGAGGINARQALVPSTVEAMVEQAVEAILVAWRSGISRQRVELLLPVPSSHNPWNPWPGGIRQEFSVAAPIVEQLLLKLRAANEAFEGRIMSDVLDDVDYVACWQNDKMAAVLFPTADSVAAMRDLASMPSEQPRLLLTINPQWTRDGQIISDFGFGQARRDAERFIDSFADVYSLQRIAVMGDEVRLLKAYPLCWHAFFVPPSSAPVQPAVSTPTQLDRRTDLELLGLEDERPSYAVVLDMLKQLPGSQASLTWMDRMLQFRRRMQQDESYDGEHPLLALAHFQESPVMQQLAATTSGTAALTLAPFVGGVPYSSGAAPAGRTAGPDAGVNRGSATSSASAGGGVQDSTVSSVASSRSGSPGQLAAAGAPGLPLSSRGPGRDRETPSLQALRDQLDRRTALPWQTAGINERFGVETEELVSGRGVARDPIRVDPVQQLAKWTGGLLFSSDGQQQQQQGGTEAQVNLGQQLAGKGSEQPGRKQ